MHFIDSSHDMNRMPQNYIIQRISLQECVHFIDSSKNYIIYTHSLSRSFALFLSLLLSLSSHTRRTYQEVLHVIDCMPHNCIIHTRSLFLALFRSLSLFLSLSISLSSQPHRTYQEVFDEIYCTPQNYIMYTHTLSHSRSLALSLFFSLSFSRSLSLAHTHTDHSKRH